MMKTFDHKPTTSHYSRRHFLQAGLGGVVATGLLLSPLNHLARAAAPVRQLTMYNIHTGEWGKKICYWEKGRYVQEGLNQLNHLLRDHRANRVAEIDPKLFDLLHVLNQRLEPGQAFHIISGYRCPKTNTALRSASNGVAKRSLHMKAKAIDTRLPGVALSHLRKAGLNLHRGGVGYYPKSNFVHLDTGRVRQWGG